MSRKINHIFNNLFFTFPMNRNAIIFSDCVVQMIEITYPLTSYRAQSISKRLFQR